jgi:alkaline phosphatase
LYTWGIKGSNDCAAPSSRIVDPAACASAAAAAGKTYDGVVDNDSYPRGCAWYAHLTHADARAHGRLNARAHW